LTKGRPTPHVSNLGVTWFRQDNGNYKTARRRMMAPLSIIQILNANSYEYALAA